jgi:hypothetical protein
MGVDIISIIGSICSATHTQDDYQVSNFIYNYLQELQVLLQQWFEYIQVVFSADNRQLQTICSQALSHEIIRLFTFTISNLNYTVLRELQFVWSNL